MKEYEGEGEHEEDDEEDEDSRDDSYVPGGAKSKRRCTAPSGSGRGGTRGGTSEGASKGKGKGKKPVARKSASKPVKTSKELSLREVKEMFWVSTCALYSSAGVDLPPEDESAYLRSDWR
jgi:hypothetical protein